ncbi:hypothetical protein EB796_006513 [Bugula neritina]|uniref:Uncharacterized protein n=1 Tax=Bugula neritina TaxID=10212 RepID=A0A7J7KBH7_BUGNE|nr:hypothetical protein EB796_006513 [Bugula neritina]
MSSSLFCWCGNKTSNLFIITDFRLVVNISIQLFCSASKRQQHCTVSIRGIDYLTAYYEVRYLIYHPSIMLSLMWVRPMLCVSLHRA